jgi:hypothetical protein
MQIRQAQIEALQRAVGRIIERCPYEQVSGDSGSGSEDERLLKCILELCKTDRDVVAKLKRLKLLARNPKRVEVYLFEGGEWTKKVGKSKGSTRDTTVWLNRDLPCGELKGTLYHEVVHTDQPPSMPRPQKEIDAYTQTEQWTIKRKLPSQSADNSFRETLPDGTTVPSSRAIKDHVRRGYGFNVPDSGPLPPQVVGRTDLPGGVLLDDGTTRAVREGDSFMVVPKQELNEQLIPPEKLKCS